MFVYLKDQMNLLFVWIEDKPGVSKLRARYGNLFSRELKTIVILFEEQLEVTFKMFNLLLIKGVPQKIKLSLSDLPWST